MKTESVDVGTQKLARQTKARHRAAQRQDLLPGARPEGDAVSDGCPCEGLLGRDDALRGIRPSRSASRRNPHDLPQRADDAGSLMANLS
jgi:hypothetical protein